MSSSSIIIIRRNIKELCSVAMNAGGFFRYPSLRLDKQMNGHRDVDANFNEEEQLATEEWRLTMAQGLAMQDEEVGVEVDKEDYDDCNAYDEMMMIDSMA